MPYNGVGVFTRVYQWVQDAANGIFVDATRTDTDSNDIAAGLTNCVTRDGQSPWTANLPAGGFKITGLASGSAVSDSVNYGQVFNNPAFNSMSATGTVNFAGATTVTVPTVAAGDNSTKAASTAFVVGQAFSAALPAQTGNADKVVTTNGSVASWTDLLKAGTMKWADSTDTTKRVQFDLSGLTTGQTRTMRWQDRSGYVGGMDRSSRTANAILTQADANIDIVITGAGGFTQTLTAAATLGAGWNCRYWNGSSGNITFDPNSGELIDGATTGILEPGMGIDIRCDGTKFDCERIGPAVMKILTSGTSGTWPLGVRVVDEIQGGAGGGGGRSSVTAAGMGANSGATARKQWVVSPNTGYTYAIGAGGVAATVAGNNGNAGGVTTFTYNAVTVTTNGGGAGTNQTAIIQTTRQTATGGDINIGSGLGWTEANGSYGGNPSFGLGEGGRYSSGLSAGVIGTGFCAGGASGNSSANGQDGLPGVVILRY